MLFLIDVYYVYKNPTCAVKEVRGTPESHVGLIQFRFRTGVFTQYMMQSVFYLNVAATTNKM